MPLEKGTRACLTSRLAGSVWSVMFPLLGRRLFHRAQAQKPRTAEFLLAGYDNAIGLCP